MKTDNSRSPGRRWVPAVPLLARLITALSVVAMMLGPLSTAQAARPASKPITSPQPQKPMTNKQHKDAATRLLKARKDKGLPLVTTSTTLAPSATPDYFGTTPNYANSPLPPNVFVGPPNAVSASATVDSSGRVTGVSVTNAGSGFVSTSPPPVTIAPPPDPAGVQATATATVGTGGAITAITVTYAGSGYDPAKPPAVSVGVQATGVATVQSGAVTAIKMTNSGSGYVTPPAITISGYDGTGAAAHANLAVGGPASVAAITLNSGGSGYTTAPTVTISGGGGTGATATATLSSTGSVTTITLTKPGSGYTSVPTVTLDPPGGSGTQATATATLANTGSVVSLNLNNGGAGYTSAPTVTLSGGNGTGARATATLSASGAVRQLTLTNGGSGYTTAPTVTLTGGGGSGATATATLAPEPVASLTLTSGGTGYSSAPTVNFNGGGGSGASATATLAPRGVARVSVTSGGSSYKTAPAVSFSGGGGSGAAATATISSIGVVTGVTVTAAGSGYTSAPTVSLSGGSGKGAAATAVLQTASVASLTLTNGGSNFRTPPTVSFSGGGGSGAAATANLAAAPVSGLTVTNGGTSYTSAPSVGFSGGGGSGAAATASIGFPVASLNLTAGGSGYTTGPTVSFSGGGGTGAAATAAVGYALASLSMTNVGSGYTTAPNVSITGGGGSGATATAALGYAVGSLNLTNGGTGYTSPPTVGFSGGGGNGASATAALVATAAGVTSITVDSGGSGYGGIRKFVDSLPGLGAGGKNDLGQYIPVAVPDTTTFPGSDYYVIGLKQYTEKLHADLPATTLRGYYQINGPDQTASYLGPIIVAQKDRPVRIKFMNQLPTGAGGNLFLPVDTTVMGAGTGPNGGSYTENRATLHLHGGNTPWISDGTMHQWITPAGESTPYPKGVSVRYVPDMWYDSGGNPIAACDNPPLVTCNVSGATTNPGDGSQTFYYTNQQTARLMFYHDHAYGITRLNVYAGEAAGYVLRDNAEQSLITKGDIPQDEIPLIIQDKTFVPGDGQLAAEDPTWNKSTWGGAGNLWHPHVYMPNQNPSDPSGANAAGRWDYGPWFWPPFTGLTNGPVPNPLAGQPGENSVNPGTPNPSIVPEAFMDTPLVNGTPYPYVKVGQKAYRFRILNASNDRTLNLQLYFTKSNGQLWDASGNLNDPNAGEVPMVPFVSGGGFPASWGTPDSRDGGVPDPRAAGPDWLQIGTEGGFLPHVATIHSQPANYDYNRRSVVVLNVLQKSLFLGPAERADVIVDFSRAPAGSKLILYNDAPAPVPAFDSRYDYYTGDPDQACDTDPNGNILGNCTGGAPTTLPGYGPNTRTMMQIQVDGSLGTGPGASLTLDHDLAQAYGGSMDAPIIPQASYNAAFGANWPADPPYVRIQNTTLAVTNGMYGIPAVQVTNGGSGYDPNAPPNVTISGGGGTGAAATATVDGTGAVTGVTITNPGKGYTSAPTVTIDAPTAGGTTAAATAVISETMPLQPKAIQELFDPDYGRMNATLGVEIPNTTGTNQTTIPYFQHDPPTEILNDTDPSAPIGSQIATLTDGTQIWKVTHNGVDTHPLHFHLFNVQVINRVGWDGAIRPPDPNELGWKDTVRMNPLEDAIVALRPMKQTLPWSLPNSIRPLDPAMSIGDGTNFTGIDPSGAPAAANNQYVNLGWEYVWHCHILGHEENDFMRPVGMVVKPVGLTPDASGAPANLTATASAGGVNLSWTNQAVNETNFTVQRSDSATGPWTTLTTTVIQRIDQISAAGKDPNTVIPGYGAPVTYTDTSAASGTTYYYQVIATNTVGDTQPYAAPAVGYPTMTASSAPSSAASVTAQ